MRVHTVVIVKERRALISRFHLQISMRVKLVFFLLFVVELVSTHRQRLEWNTVSDNRHLQCCYTTADIDLHPALWKTFYFPELITLQNIDRGYRVEFTISAQNEVECGKHVDQYWKQTTRCYYETVYKRCGYATVGLAVNVQQDVWVCYTNSSNSNDSFMLIYKLLPVLPASTSSLATTVTTTTTTAAASTAATATSGTKTVEYFPLFVICVFSQLVILARDW